jgi:hypothetical protein
MTDNYNDSTSLTPANGDHHDGFSDCDGGGSDWIRGDLTKFTSDYRYVARTGEQLTPDRRFLLAETIRLEQSWPKDGGKPKSRILKPDEPFADIEAKNEAVRFPGDPQRSEWRMSFGKLVGPYENAYAGYLLAFGSETDPRKTYQIYTFLSATNGGAIAFRIVKQNIIAARAVRGPYAFPIVSLQVADFNNNFGRRRPDFHIIDYEILKPATLDAPAVSQEPAAQIEAPKEPKNAKSKVSKKGESDDEFNDTIPI